MRGMFVVAFALAAGSTSGALVQTKTYRWADACQNTVRYDSRKVDGRALENTVEILNIEGVVPIPPSVGAPSDIAKLDPAAFERDCRALAEKIRAFKLLPLPGIEDLRTERARHVDDACMFGVAKIRGYSQPSALRGYPLASPHCDIYVDALEGKADMTALWRKRIAEDCRSNASPAACRKRDEDRGNGTDGAAWKRLYLADFSWGNCAINHTDFNREDPARRTARFEKLNLAFRKAYQVTRRCDEGP